MNKETLIERFEALITEVESDLDAQEIQDAFDEAMSNVFEE